MIYFIQINKETNRVEGYSSTKIEDEKFIEKELDSDNKEYEELFKSPMIFIYNNSTNTFIKDIEYQNKLIEEENSLTDDKKITKLTKELAKNKIDNMQKDTIISMLIKEQAKLKIEKMQAKGGV